ncbi:MAG: pyruvoyl-dependent arginine decarboxylase, partial [Firmicutes bacterium]|nr:pyruvoyl-dependent arginine decarboxylase [Bacillota bacterium]
ILPPGAQYVDEVSIPAGSLTPTAYGALISEVPGETIAAAVAVGLSEDSFGVIMEYSGRCSGEEAEQKVVAMVENAFAQRQIPLKKTLVKSVEHKVDAIGCVFAAVALWY